MKKLKTNTELEREFDKTWMETLKYKKLKQLFLKTRTNDIQVIIGIVEEMEKCNHDLFSIDGICKKCSMSNYDEIIRDREHNQTLEDLKSKLKQYYE